jgi:murein DD-endopeptidase MepM/ murein hydrolase activator NlpD
VQFIWISDATVAVKRVSISARKAALILISAILALVLLGAGLHFVIFRLALVYDPGLALSLGGVTTEAEHQKTQAEHREQLEKLRQALGATLQEVRQLEGLKNNFMELATPVDLRSKPKPADESRGGRGGPWLSPGFQLRAPRGLEGDLAAAVDEFTRTATDVQKLAPGWTKQIDWLSGLPTGLPILQPHHTSSAYGIRPDPITGQLAMHEGVDFVAALHTPVLASAGGTVTRSGWDEAYGNVVEIEHLEAFTTRYAHLSKRLVSIGQAVQRQEKIGELGNTGRSTGPHLHYEVLRHGRAINPAAVLPKDSLVTRR